MNLVIPVIAAASDHGNLVSAERRRVLNAHCRSHAQLGKGSVVMIIVCLLDLGSLGGSTTVADLRFGLPFLGEGLRVGGDAGAKGVGQTDVAQAIVL